MTFLACLQPQMKSKNFSQTSRPTEKVLGLAGSTGCWHPLDTVKNGEASGWMRQATPILKASNTQIQFVPMSGVTETT